MSFFPDFFSCEIIKNIPLCQAQWRRLSTSCVCVLWRLTKYNILSAHINIITPYLPLCRALMSAPNMLRVGAVEKIFVECQDCNGNDIIVRISVMNHPSKKTLLATTSVTLNAENNFQQLGQITVNETLSLYMHIICHRYLASFNNSATQNDL